MGQEKPSTVVLLITKFAYRYMYFCNFLLFWRFNRHAITITHIYFTNIYYVVVVVIPVTRRVRCYTRFIEKYVIGRRQSFHHMKPIYSRSGSISESIWRCPSVCMNVEISGTIQSRRLRLSIQMRNTRSASLLAYVATPTNLQKLPHFFTFLLVF